jgi:ankyrin repeat protein
MVARKTCTACGKRLSAVAFNGSAQTVDGLARTCRACTNARRRLRDRSRDKRAPPPGIAAAIRRGDTQAVRKSLRSGVTPQGDWICETMRAGHLALAEALVEAGVQSNIFTLAAMGDAKGLARRLRRVPADARLAVCMEPSSERVTPLHVGCAADWSSHGSARMAVQVQVAETLREHGADLNAVARYRGIDDATPLLCACWTSANLALVRWLLGHGARATDGDLLAALGHLQRHGKGAYDIAEALLAWGLPVDGGVRGVRTPLQTFAHQADRRTVAWLMAHGAKVNARGPGGRTAAHFAAERNTGPATLELLVEGGADLSARDNDGRTPKEIANLNGKTRLVEWIAARIRRKRR